jgi:hypothetical protein
METGLIWQPSAIAALTAMETASRFKTGRAPEAPGRRHMCLNSEALRTGTAATKELAACQQLCVYFKSNYGLKFHGAILTSSNLRASPLLYKERIHKH